MKNHLLSYATILAGLMVTCLMGHTAPVSEGPSAGTAQMFPFVLPWDDASKTVVDVSSLNPAPLDASRQIIVKKGHFYDQTGRRVRLLGVNMALTANFPNKSDADKIAARMHKFGINCVRLVDLDVRSPQGLISSKFPDTQHLDPDQWDKLDYFIAALKKNGIYVDIPLHFDGTFNASDGLPDVAQPRYSGKILWYEPRLIELQKQYAKDLLDHVNPYTGLRYADDPVLALVETVNEDSLTVTARDVNFLKGYIGSYYFNDLKNGWNTFLVKKYGTDQKLLQAWGNEASLDNDQSLEKGNIDLPQKGDTARHDYFEYLTDLEEHYAQEMHDYIKNDLGVHAAVNCSIVSGSIAGLWREDKSDFVDEHAYWQHPAFSSTSWSKTGWTITNTPMVLSGMASGSPFPGLATSRISNKPFTVTEYDHPSPSDYSAETLPMLASYAAWQNWDGIFLFDYNSDKSTFQDDHFNGYFMNDHHPGKMAFFPAAARIFLADTSLRANAPTKELIIPTAGIIDMITKYAATYPSLIASLQDIYNSVGIGGPESIANPIQARFASIDKLQLKTIPPLGNDAIHLSWQADTTAKAGLYTVSAPQWNAVVNYNPSPAPITSGDLTINPLNKDRPFGAYTLTSMDNKPVNTSKKLLFTAGGFVENQNMGWNADHTSVGDQWGHGPVMAEGLEATITLKTSARHATVYALDATGKEKEEVPSKLSDGELAFTIGPKFATMWYAIEQ